MNRETTIYTMRHAHTTFNDQKKYAGTIDISINDRGKTDIEKIRPFFNDCHFDVVVTSQLKRCIETADLLLNGRIHTIQSELCNERCFGIMEGMTWEEVQKLDPPLLFIKVGGDLHSVNPQGGEPFEDIWERAKQLRQMLLEQYAGKSILVISHGVFLQMFHGLLQGLSCIESLAHYPGNLEINRFLMTNHVLKEYETVKFQQYDQTRW
jgi:broad specificity phosphatase PhoE